MIDKQTYEARQNALRASHGLQPITAPDDWFDPNRPGNEPDGPIKLSKQSMRKILKQSSGKNSESNKEIDKSTVEELNAKFQATFPLLFTVIDKVENKEKEANKEKSAQKVVQQKIVDRSESVAEGLSTIAVEQGKSVNLLKELLDAVKGLKDQRDNTDDAIGGKRSRLLNAAIGLGAAGAGALAYNILEGLDSNREQPTTPQRQVPVNGGPGVQAQRERGSLNDELREMVRSGQLTREQANDISRRTLTGEITSGQAREEARRNTASVVQTPGVTPGVAGSTPEQDALGRQFYEATKRLEEIERERLEFQNEFGEADTTRTISPDPNSNIRFRPYEAPAYSNPEAQSRYEDISRRASEAQSQQRTAREEASRNIAGARNQDGTRAPSRVIQALTERFGYTQEQLQSYGGGATEDNFIQTDSGRYSPQINQLFDDEVQRDLMQRGSSPQSTQGPTSNLTFAPGVDPRINRDIAEKTARLQSVAPGMVVTSGFRDPERNARAGGARNSAHLDGSAVDIQFNGNEQDTVRVIEAASAAGIGGIGVYRPGWLHLDTKSRRAWGPDFTAASIPQWARPSLEEHTNGQATSPTMAQPVENEPAAAPLTTEGSATPAATPAGSTPTTGAAVASASQENAVAERTPGAASPGSSFEVATSGQASPGTETPGTFSSPNDPGSVEPPDSAERYARLFNMAA